MNNRSYTSYEKVYIDSENNRWFFSFDINALFKMTSQGKLEMIVTIQEYDYLESGLFFAAGEYNNSIILVPRMASHIVYVNKNSGKYEMIPLPCDWKNKFKFFATFIERNELYMFGHMIPIILKINLHTKEFICFDLSNKIRGNWQNEGVFRNQLYKLENILYLPCMFSNQIMEFDLSSNKYDFFDIGNENMRFSGICGDKNNVWISCLNSNELIHLNLVTRKFEILEFLVEEINNNNKFTYLMSIFYQGKVVLIPAYNNPYIIYDILTEKFTKINYLPSKTSVIPIRCSYLFMGEIIFVYEENGEHIYFSDNRLVPYEIECNINNLKTLRKVNLQKHIIKESLFMSLSDFLSRI